MQAVRLFDVKLSTGGYQEFQNHVQSLACNGKSSYVCIANVHVFVEAKKNNFYRAQLNAADVVTPDGMPLVWTLKWLHGVKQPRVAGMDFLPDLLSSAERMKNKVFFYGGTEEMLAKTKSHLQVNYPRLHADYYSPPFRPLTFAEEETIVGIINDCAPKLVFVALGCPKQEKWMASMKGRIHACMIGIGGALPVMIGMQRRAPQWMQKAGLEWLFRLAQEPRRLFKRYAVTNTIFCWLLFKAWAKQGFRARKPKLEQVSS
jgi:N-acetylglucosaminyldiphosphoundecaprenol N-acetyl-beta-D-mannosaminyltransferase